MNATTRSSGRTLWVAARALLVLTATLGLGYTALVTIAGQLLFPAPSNGTLLRDDDGRVVGSALLGQSFAAADGAPLPQFFQPRPSAAGEGYDATASAGSNLGPENADLVAAIVQRRAEIAAFNGVAEADVPSDAVTASASGLDPHISPAYARLQAERVAQARGVPLAEVLELIDAHTARPALGFLGDPAVNVVTLNLALDEREG
ncbi:potassium-transporting ATPase subunit KdpC [Microbacterium sp. Marseille-Q6965]|uniref:potassium-transporting ATPase subunit KdpC n=1 Tax=Microbacterium sp. Marseille-Q6965 TaxID=2965072 RepID=UPI0021B76184|nr:potassium-transporting ATPase subunit KdpC [Microbacterium sp. Marseille-Q6965]